jgi:hypothetical protein
MISEFSEMTIKIMCRRGAINPVRLQTIWHRFAIQKPWFTGLSGLGSEYDENTWRG